MPLEGVSVLIVEDHADHRDLAWALLTHLGARVDVAGNGEQGRAQMVAQEPVAAWVSGRV